MAEKKIEVVELPVKELQDTLGNPRTITSKKKAELSESLDRFGDFGLILIDENNNLIAGHQRVAVLKEKDPETTVLCKRLIGYTETELKAINIKDNTHAGEWDLDMLADWNAEIMVELGVDNDSVKGKEPSERDIKEMELIHYEKYDYVMIVCRDELSYNSLVRTLGIEDAKTLVGPKKRPIKGRAIWYDDMKVDLVPKGSAE